MNGSSKEVFDFMDEASIALEAIRKKLVGKRLTYNEIFAVMDQIAHKRLNQILTTYFAASGYSNGFNNEEMYFLTKAMIDSARMLRYAPRPTRQMALAR